MLPSSSCGVSSWLWSAFVWCKRGNGSHEADGPFQIVAAEEEVQASGMHQGRFGERERFANKSTKTLPKGIIPAHTYPAGAKRSGRRLSVSATAGICKPCGRVFLVKKVILSVKALFGYLLPTFHTHYQVYLVALPYMSCSSASLFSLRRTPILVG
jgi:hypothetical protein